jgi:hypothetical protein
MLASLCSRHVLVMGGLAAALTVAPLRADARLKDLQPAQSLNARLQSGCQKVCDVGRRVCQPSCDLGRRIGRGAVGIGKWVRQHPRQTLGIGVGAAAMFGVVFWAAPALGAGVTSWLTPLVGKTAGSVLGTAAGGALASGSRSLLVFATPMLTGVDPFNKRQLATDVGMSAGFNFLGFANAAALKSAAAVTGLDGAGLFALNVAGLVGFELGKDYAQNRIRNRVATAPKPFRQIWRKSLVMEVTTNLHRCIPGLGMETNYGAKILGDLGGTIWWDRIVNKRNPQDAAARAALD